MKEGEHYERREETIEGGFMKGYTFVRFITTLGNWRFEYNISPEATHRGEDEIQKKIGDREAILALQQTINETIFKGMTKNPVLYDIMIKTIHKHSIPFYPTKAREAIVGVSREIPEGKMLLILNPKDFQVLEDHDAE